MTNLKPGDKAPEINVVDQSGNIINLEDYKGSKVIVFFYPKANTPGCTAEACNLRDNYDDLLKRGFKIIGISADNETRQKNFAEKYELPFPLIPDVDKKIIKDYGVWGLKKNYGREYEGIFRTTFIISKDGAIEKIFEKVKTKEHSEQILKEYEN
jgi:peroxiredoxin Q/BCP